MALSLNRTSFTDPDADERDGAAESVVDSAFPLASEDSFEVAESFCGPSTNS
jgi:hypothetical protein